MLAKYIQWCIRSLIETVRWVRWCKRNAYLCCFFCKNVWNNFLAWCQVVLVCGGIRNFLKYIFSRLIFGILVECIKRISEYTVWLVCSRNFISFISRFSKRWRKGIWYRRMRAISEHIAWFVELLKCHVGIRVQRIVFFVLRVKIILRDFGYFTDLLFENVRLDFFWN